MKLGIIGDLHLKLKLSFSEYIEDERLGEKQNVYNTIYREFEDCDGIVFMGDNLNCYMNSPSVITDFVQLIKGFSGKEIFILCGNHEVGLLGKSAIDFIKELKDPHIHAVIDDILKFDNFVFVPYFSTSSFNTKDHKEASLKLQEKIASFGGDYIFLHQAISGTEVGGGITTDSFLEIVLDKEFLKKNYKQVFAGHIHKHSQDENIKITGSVFTNEVNEKEKWIFKLNTDLNIVESIKLPVTPIVKIVNPDDEKILLNKGNIVKCIISDVLLKDKIDHIKELLSQNTKAFIIIEQYPNQREKIEVQNGGSFDFSIDNLLTIYASAKQQDINQINKAFNYIRNYDKKEGIC